MNKNWITDVVKNGGAFDSQFYLDQSGPRTLTMQIRKVTKEFRQLEINCLAREARQYARKVSAYGTFQHVSYDVDDDAGDNCDEEEFLDKSYNEQKDQTSIVETRSQSSRKLLPVTMSDKSIQVTDLTEQTSV